jgi:hypothetical protein
MNEADGPYRLARALLDEANSLGMENVAIDGIRQRSTLQELKTLSTDVSSGRNGRPLAVLFVHAAPDVRLIMDEDEDEDIEPGPPDEENEAFDAGWQAAIAAWDAQAPGALNPYPKDTVDHRNWDEGAHEWCSNNV